MDLPLMLAGPILRRVDPSLVAVWMAFSEPADLELRVFEGRVAHDTTNPVFVSSDDPPDPSAPPPRPGAEAVRIGEHLYLGLVTARLPPASGKVLLPDRLYSYDVIINAGGETLGLGERGLLATRTVNGVEVPPLGYDAGCCRASRCRRPSSITCGSSSGRVVAPPIPTATRWPISTTSSVDQAYTDPRAHPSSSWVATRSTPTT